MSDIHSRLKLARERAGFERATHAAERFNWTYSTYAGHENGSRGVPRDELLRYAKAFDVSAEWLLTGVWATAERSLFESEPGPEYVTTPERVEHDDEPPTNKRLVPVYDVEASAGFGSHVGYEAHAYSLAFPPDYLKRLTTSAPGNLAIISVKGDSMEPTLLDDDIVLLDTSKTDVSYDGLFVLEFGSALHVKRVGRSAKRESVSVISDNPLFPALDMNVSEVRAIGKVLWYGRKV